MTSSSTKMAQAINFKLCSHIFIRLLHKIVPAFFLIVSYSVFYFNNLTGFERGFCMETVKSKLFKKYLKKRKSRSRFCLLIGYMSLKKNLENFNSVGAGANKVGQVVSFCISFDPNFTNIWKA